METLSPFLATWYPRILAIFRIVLGYPPYLLLLAITVWAVRRARAETPTAEIA